MTAIHLHLENQRVSCDGKPIMVNTRVAKPVLGLICIYHIMSGIKVRTQNELSPSGSDMQLSLVLTCRKKTIVLNAVEIHMYTMKIYFNSIRKYYYS